jgi:hypothetical protein
MGDKFMSEGVMEVEINCDCVDNPSLFIGVAAPGFWEDQVAAAADEDELLPRDSTKVICMHGDGRCFIRGQEKDWGLMRLATGEAASGWRASSAARCERQ